MNRLHHISPRILAVLMSLTVMGMLVMQISAASASLPTQQTEQSQSASSEVASEMSHQMAHHMAIPDISMPGGHCDSEDSSNQNCGGTCCCVISFADPVAFPSSGAIHISNNQPVAAKTSKSTPSAPPPRV